MTKPIIWLLYFVAAGCAAAQPASSDRPHTNNTHSTAWDVTVIRHVETELDAVQRALATPPEETSQAADAETPTSVHGRTAHRDGTPTLGPKQKKMGMRDNAPQPVTTTTPGTSITPRPSAASSPPPNTPRAIASKSSMRPAATMKPSATLDSSKTAAQTANADQRKMNKGQMRRGPSVKSNESMPRGMGRSAMMRKRMCCGAMGSMMGKPQDKGGSADTNASTDEVTAAGVVTSGTGHVLHLGELDFYLDLQTELAFTSAQRSTLTQHRTRWLSERDRRQGAIDAAESKLWQLTQALTPNPQQVAAAVRDVERLRGEQRLAFIESVSAAVATLTPVQIAHLRTLPHQGSL